MRLEANNIGSVDHQKIQGSGGTNESIGKSASIMVGDDVLIGHCWHLLVLIQWWDLFSHHHLVIHSRRRSRRCSFALLTGGTPSVDHRDVTSDIGSLINLTRNHREGGGEAQRAMNEGKEFSKHEWESMGLGMHNGVQLYMCGKRHSVMIHFPVKRFLSVSTTWAIRPRDWGVKKAGILKYFKVRSAQE
jgi:hypothetical protein